MSINMEEVKKFIDEQFEIDRKIKQEWLEKQAVFQLAKKMITIRTRHSLTREKLAKRLGVEVEIIENVEKLNRIPLEKVEDLFERINSIPFFI